MSTKVLGFESEKLTTAIGACIGPGAMALDTDPVLVGLAPGPDRTMPAMAPE
jgi:hypothetical protein